MICSFVQLSLRGLYIEHIRDALKNVIFSDIVTIALDQDPPKAFYDASSFDRFFFKTPILINKIETFHFKGSQKCDFSLAHSGPLTHF